MTENEIITQQDPQMQIFSQLMGSILKREFDIRIK